MRVMKEHCRTVQNPARMWSSHRHKGSAITDGTSDRHKVLYILFTSIFFYISQDWAVLRPEQDHRASARDLATCP